MQGVSLFVADRFWQLWSFHIFAPGTVTQTARPKYLDL